MQNKEVKYIETVDLLKKEIETQKREMENIFLSESEEKRSFEDKKKEFEILKTANSFAANEKVTLQQEKRELEQKNAQILNEIAQQNANLSKIQKKNSESENSLKLQIDSMTKKLELNEKKVVSFTDLNTRLQVTINADKNTVLLLNKTIEDQLKAISGYETELNALKMNNEGYDQIKSDYGTLINQKKELEIQFAQLKIEFESEKFKKNQSRIHEGPGYRVNTTINNNKIKAKCSVFGCDGSGNTRGKFRHHYSSKFCPKAKSLKAYSLKDLDACKSERKVGYIF